MPPSSSWYLRSDYTDPGKPLSMPAFLAFASFLRLSPIKNARSLPARTCRIEDIKSVLGIKIPMYLAGKPQTMPTDRRQYAGMGPIYWQNAYIRIRRPHPLTISIDPDKRTSPRSYLESKAEQS
jgi:hypothetical protein